MIDEPKAAVHCRWCGEAHEIRGLLCPWLKAIEFHADGVTIRRVEFVMPTDLGQGAPQAAPDPVPPQDDYRRKRPAKFG